jgi:hypothetical protein
MDRVCFERVTLAARAVAILATDRQREQRFVMRFGVLIRRFERDAAETDAGDAAGKAREKFIDERARQADRFEVQPPR